MTTTKKLTRKLDHAAERIQPALQVLAQLRQAMLDGKTLSAQIALADELGDTLLGLEDAVGVVTQARLFE